MPVPSVTVNLVRCRCGTTAIPDQTDMCRSMLNVQACAVCYDALLVDKNLLVKDNQDLLAEVKRLTHELDMARQVSLCTGMTQVST